MKKLTEKFGKMAFHEKNCRRGSNQFYLFLCQHHLPRDTIPQSQSARQQSSSTGRTHWRGDMEICKTQTRFCHLVHGGSVQGRIHVRPQISPTKIVPKENDDIRSGVLILGARCKMQNKRHHGNEKHHFEDQFFSLPQLHEFFLRYLLEWIVVDYHLLEQP